MMLLQVTDEQGHITLSNEKMEKGNDEVDDGDDG
jgi:hypothetical protein